MIKHGESNTRLYRCWDSMKSRAKSRNDCEVATEWLVFLTFKPWTLYKNFLIEYLMDKYFVYLTERSI